MYRITSVSFSVFWLVTAVAGVTKNLILFITINRIRFVITQESDMLASLKKFAKRGGAIILTI